MYIAIAGVVQHTKLFHFVRTVIPPPASGYASFVETSTAEGTAVPILTHDERTTDLYAGADGSEKGIEAVRAVLADDGWITLGLLHPRTRVPTCLPRRPESLRSFRR